MPLEPGATLGTYDLQSRLGGGGMGEVWRAYDPNLQRTVAIKVLKDTEEAASRILTEARSASALNHPHICTIYEVDEADGQSFIVMEHVEGKPLSELIPSDGLPPESVIRYGTQIADALAHAHEHGIVHRDLKSANVVVTPDGRAKVLDFGVADKLPHPDAEAVTRAQALPVSHGPVGTLAYMAPEVLRGETATPQSDIWALGVVLYEMASGQQPFRGPRVTDLIAAILKDTPDPVPTRVPPGLRAITRRTLAKEATHRYATSGELRAALEALGASGIADAPSAVSEAVSPSIAVLPFSNLGADASDEYFSDGLTEDISTDLSKIGGIAVVPRTSVARLYNADMSPRAAGQVLNAQYLLEGNVRKAGRRLRVTAKLIDAGREVQLWAERYDGTLDDVFAIQEAVAKSLAAALEVTLSAEDKREIASHSIPDAEAYDSFLKARRELMRHTPESLDNALTYLREALDRSGDNPLLLTALGQTLWIGAHALLDIDEHAALAEVERIAGRLLTLDVDSAQGHSIRGLAAFKRRDLKGFVAGQRRALELDPHDTFTLWVMCFGLAEFGHLDAARPLLATLRRVDAFNPMTYWTAGWIDSMEDMERALPSFERAHRMDPENAIIRFSLGRALAFIGERNQAIALLDSMRDTPRHYWYQLGLALSAALKGSREEFEKVLTPQVTRRARWDETFSLFLAEACAVIDDKDEALDWLDAAINHHFINYPFLAEHDRFLDNLRQEPRFHALLAEAEREWKRLAN